MSSLGFAHLTSQQAEIVAILHICNVFVRINVLLSHGASSPKLTSFPNARKMMFEGRILQGLI